MGALKLYFDGENAAWEPVQESNRANLRSAGSASIHNYPYADKFIQLDDPWDTIDRNTTKLRLLKMIDIIDAKDYKLIENNYGFQVFFNKDYDLAHFQEVYDDKKSFKGAASNSFQLNCDKKTFIKHAKALSRCFTKAIVSSGLAENIDIEIDPTSNAINIFATTLESYLTFWRGIPEEQRQLLHG